MGETSKLSKRARFKQFFKGSNDSHIQAGDATRTTSSILLEPPSSSGIGKIAQNDSTVSKDDTSLLGVAAMQSHQVLVSANADEAGALITARNELWKRAFRRLKKEQPELALVYESLVKSDAGVDQSTDAFTPDAIAVVVQKQQTRMDSKQWTYSWFGKPRKVRDTAESILSTINKVSGLVSVGMSSAPPFVLLPWSMAKSLVAFVMSDFEAISSAIEGLKEVTRLLANYSYAEREFLLNSNTKKDYEDIVLALYSSILEYQALAA
ncbi:hypothetical protein N0V90_005645 [Kalmusia sp. IMI 367209]|nr:hypothetical protein N0V90_005645 [Kalmusia sp. IMI 367209]